MTLAERLRMYALSLANAYGKGEMCKDLLDSADALDAAVKALRFYAGSKISTHWLLDDDVGRQARQALAEIGAEGDTGPEGPGGDEGREGEG